MIIDITVADIKQRIKLPLKFSSDTIKDHIRTAEIDLRKKLGANYKTDADAKEVLRHLKILFTLITLVPEANSKYTEGLNKAREKGDDFQYMSQSQVDKKIKRYNDKVDELVDMVVIYPDEVVEEEDVDPNDLILDDDTRMSTNDGDWDETYIV